jgi:acetyl esterase/lipase
VSTALAQSNPKIQTDIVYRTVDKTNVKLDLCIPTEGRGPFPVVMCVHGGGWRMGNKRDLHSWLDALSRQGYVAVSVGYRLAPEHRFPAQIEDCKTAVRFLRANAEKYNIAKDRIGVMGYSAGGHLVCLLGLTDAKAGFDGPDYPKESSAVQLVIDYFGPKDFASYAKDDAAQRSMLGPLIGAKYNDNPEAHNKAAPLNYVRKDAPPFLLFHGTKDWMVSVEQSRQFYDKMKQVGAPITLVEVPGESHGWSGDAQRRTNRQTFDFLAEHLKK